MPKKPEIISAYIRMPADLHARLIAECEGSPRNSLNAEIVQRLIESFQPHLTEEECRARHEAAADAFMRTITELQNRLRDAERRK